VYETQSPTTTGMVPHHQQHGSLGGQSRFALAQDSRRVAETAPQSAGQPYVRYTGTPNPAQPARDARDPAAVGVNRSYTPVSSGGFDPRGPPRPGPPPPGQPGAPQGYASLSQQQQQELALRDQHMREAQIREMQQQQQQQQQQHQHQQQQQQQQQEGPGSRTLREQQGGDAGLILGRQLRPGPPEGPQNHGPGSMGLYEREGRRY
jgi:hypothetical protein